MAPIARDARLERLHFLVETQRLINAGPADPERVMSLVAQRAQAACGADGAAFELVEGDVLVAQGATGLTEVTNGQQAALEQGLSGKCARLGMPLVCRDAQADGRVDTAACRALEIRSVAVAPLVQGAHGLGVLKVTSRRADAFDDSDADVLELMANMVVSSLSASTLSCQLGTDNPLQDPLTGLANQLLLMDRLGQQVYESRRYGRPFGLFVIDIDRFSAMNEALGREGGDTVLRAVSRGLNATVRSGDTLARLEADQFVILCANAERPVVEDRLKDRIANVMAAVNDELGLEAMALNATVGVVWSSGNDASAERLLTSATTALYRAKRQRYATARR